ncbi:hypothetical protein [Neobacillus terrae]|uniref:hypothetical protein n=1 Tax=Neobacillus terrae TaxID=3034837 RepID=UPI001FB18D31|nr:hypothetical protein [Neobacillus terrae]
MTRDDIVNATYAAASKLNKFKLQHRLIDHEGYLDIDSKIQRSMEYIKKIDQLLSLSPELHSVELVKIKKEIEELNRHSICGKNELKWEVQKNYANIFSLAIVGLELLYKDYAIKVKKQIHPGSRHEIKLHV